MGVTKTHIANYFNIPVEHVEQHGRKQLFTIQYKDTQCLVSYYTIVGVYRHGAWYITRHKYSRTTSKQVSQWAYGMSGIVYIEEEIDIDNI
jgi:hypothetical protein